MSAWDPSFGSVLRSMGMSLEQSLAFLMAYGCIGPGMRLKERGNYYPGASLYFEEFDLHELLRISPLSTSSNCLDLNW